MASVAYASTTGDDSDTDVVTDFLNSNCTVETTGNVGDTNTREEVRKSLKTVESQNYCIPIINAPPSVKNTSGISLTTNNNIENTNSNNMIPTINVTPHSPASISKYNNIFEDTLCQLQNIRESVVQMKNSSAHMHDTLSNYGLLNAAILSASLPDLSATNSTSGNTPHGLAQFMMWSSAQQQYLLSTDRRKSWTAVDDLTTGGDCTNKSVSLSSLDSEEQETIRVTEQRRRSARNSTGGISTHSLNEAELVRDFERITTKRNLATEIISRIPLQKSISTSSIIAKDDIKAIARHLTDSEDENQSLLRAHAKIEVYDTVEKRRKRGSLFFRKKKDKSKMKAVSGQACQICESCGANISFTSARDHQIECKGKKTIVQKGLGGSTVNKKGTNDAAGQDMFDGGTSCLNEQSTNFNDDTPLIRSEFYNDAPVEAQDLGADPSLGIALKEYDSWSPGVSKEILKNLKELQIKRQEHIYEFIMTEKHHCQTLLVMQKVFVESMERYFPSFNINGMFPRLAELTDLHTGFLKKLRHKQREQAIVDSIADILLDFFTMEKAQQLRLAYGEFCANHRTALEQFKMYLTSRDPNFAEWYKHCLSNPLLKKKGIPECILFVTQRLTKYPLLIEPLLKSSRDDKMEQDKLTHALNLVKALLVDVDACVAEKELRERQIAIFQRTDAKSFSIYKNKPFRKSDIGVESRRRLKFEGLATLMQGRSKMQAVLVVVLTDCLCFLSENSAHNKYTFFTPENKAGVVPLQKLLIREKAGTESRGIYIISSNPSFPEMYELKVQQPKDKNVWIQSIRQAVLECPSSELLENEDLTAEEKLRIGVNKREIIEKMRQKDIEQALLLEEKFMLQLNLLKEQQQQFGGDQSAILSNSSTAASATSFLSTFGSYKDLVSADCDTTDLWKRVQNSVQEISQLASTVYTAATGVPVPRLISTVGDVQIEHNSSPTLPKRAETFAGFDEKRVQRAFPAKLAALQVMTPRLQELEEKRQPKGSSSSLIPSLISSGNSSDNYNNSAAANTAAAIAEPQKENHFTILQVSHHLQTLLCIICQQMTTIHSLQLQLALYRESPRSTYIHNDQLEELRNLQDKLQEEKTAWLKLKEQQEQDLKEMSEQQEKLQIQIKAEQEDIKQQREQLYRKMELLSNQGLLLSPNTPLMLTNTPTVSTTSSNDDSHDGGIEHNLQSTSFDTQTIGINSNGGGGSSTVDRRKDKWRTASTMTKGPPVHLISATNAPKLNQTSVKQKIPIKLSSHSSSMTPSGTGTGYSKTEKSGGSTNVNTIGVVTQLFPLKLADKRPHTPSPSTSTSSSSLFSTQLTPQHSRTGSSPAIIQHPSSNMPLATVQTPPVTVTRTDSSSTYTYGQRNTATPTTSKNSTGNFKKSTSTSQNKTLKTDEEEIYF